jgi:hypothetical protein
VFSPQALNPLCPTVVVLNQLVQALQTDQVSPERAKNGVIFFLGIQKPALLSFDTPHG